MMAKKILHLPIKRYWFNKILSGEKKREYRKNTQYYHSRFKDKLGNIRIYDEIWFTAGYGRDKPFMRVEWKGLGSEPFDGIVSYVIELGDILEVKNLEVKL